MPKKPETTGFPDQERWFRLINKFDGDEAKARAHVAAWLRAALACVESEGGWPDIFGCDVPEREPGRPCRDNGGQFIESFSVTLSLPWPG